MSNKKGKDNKKVLEILVSNVKGKYAYLNKLEQFHLNHVCLILTEALLMSRLTVSLSFTYTLLYIVVLTGIEEAH